MYFLSHRSWLLLLPLLSGFTAVAQESAPPRLGMAASSAPAEPATMAFRSALHDYQGWTDEQQVPWQQANETVRQIGGWRAYAREAAAPPAAHGEPPALPRGPASQPGARP